MKKKVNPRRVPASKADVQKAKKQATSEAVEIAFAILLSETRKASVIQGFVESGVRSST